MSRAATSDELKTTVCSPGSRGHRPDERNATGASAAGRPGGCHSPTAPPLPPHQAQPPPPFFLPRPRSLPRPPLPSPPPPFPSPHGHWCPAHLVERCHLGLRDAVRVLPHVQTDCQPEVSELERRGVEEGGERGGGGHGPSASPCTRPDPTRPDPTRPDGSDPTDPTRPDPTRPDPTRPDRTQA